MEAWQGWGGNNRFLSVSRQECIGKGLKDRRVLGRALGRGTQGCSEAYDVKTDLKRL